MTITKVLFNLLSCFQSNWDRFQSRLYLDLSEKKLGNIETHPLRGEITSLIHGIGGSLPFFSDKYIVWCTLASDSYMLQITVNKLQAWIIPSYGWQSTNDGYKIPNSSGDTFQQAIAQISPKSYFRWRSLLKHYSVIERKLSTRYQLEVTRPERKRRKRPSLYELRTLFQTALTLGDRSQAENAISLIDTYELDKALNTQMMRIRLWHHFREFNNIKTYRNLPYLRAQQSIPSAISECIREALGEPRSKFPKKIVNKNKQEEMGDVWRQWFAFFVENKDMKGARTLLMEKRTTPIEELDPDQINAYSEYWDAIYVDDELREQHEQLIVEAMVAFLGDFAQEPEFPRRSYSKIYLSLLRLWGKINAGIDRGREESHVLLELANALFILNYQIEETKSIIEEWWQARPVPSQLTFALDAIELLVTQYPDRQAAENLWFMAIDLVRRNPQQLLTSEKVLWRQVGLRIGFEDIDIQQYLPVEQEVAPEDLLATVKLKKIAIVCDWIKDW